MICLSIFELNPHFSSLELDNYLWSISNPRIIEPRLTRIQSTCIFCVFFGGGNHGKSWATHNFYPQGPQGFPMGLGFRPAADEIQLLWMKLSARLAAGGRCWRMLEHKVPLMIPSEHIYRKNCYSTEIHRFFLWEFWELIYTWRYCPCLSWFTGV